MSVIFTDKPTVRKITEAFFAEFERLRGEIIADKDKEPDFNRQGGLKYNGDGSYRIVRPKPFVKGQL